MTISRLAVLLAFMTLGLSTVFLLPRGGAQPTGIQLDLPEFVGSWKGVDTVVSDGERTTLGEHSGTEFRRKIYRNLTGNELLASIVLSGRDMSRAIHRPEWCLKAQGWTLKDSDTIPVSLGRGGTFPVTKLLSTRMIRTEEGSVTGELQTFYWFVGREKITASHWSRWAIDNRDRLFKGENQRWAFIMVSGVVPLSRDPKTDGMARKWSQNTIREFIQMLAPKVHLETVQYD